jgi:hypothetical protein
MRLFRRGGVVEPAGPSIFLHGLRLSAQIAATRQAHHQEISDRGGVLMLKRRFSNGGEYEWTDARDFMAICASLTDPSYGNLSAVAVRFADGSLVTYRRRRRVPVQAFA